MNKKSDKTNVMRILDQKKKDYQHHTYDTAYTSACEVANYLGQKPDKLFKTLVATGHSKKYYVFMVPGESQLDLKKAAKITGEKSLELIPQKELLPLTGYIHGGCSPLGMKKQFETFIDSSAATHNTIFFSAGRIGDQIEMPLATLQSIMKVTVVDICKD